MYKSESLLLAMAADTEQLTRGMPAKLQQAKNKQLSEIDARCSIVDQVMKRDRCTNCNTRSAAKRTVSTRVVMFMTLFNGFTVEGEFIASAASYMLTTPLALEAACSENDESLVKDNCRTHAQ
jgi:hypothetical protein